MRKLGVILCALALMLVAMPAASAGDIGRISGDFVGGDYPNYDPAAIESRCPAGFEWILNTFGEGHLESDAYAGNITYAGDHCSRWITGPPERPDELALGRAGAGVMTMTTPHGDDLVIRYGGLWTLQGDLSIPEFTGTVWLTYRVDGAMSSGVFAGARGRGVMLVETDTGAETGRLRGYLVIDD